MERKGKKSGTSELEARPLEVAGIAEYQEGAVVSREVVRGRNGNVTFFAFDRGQRLSEHTAPFDALVIVVDGRAEISVGGKAHRVDAGNMILMPADVPHALKALTKFKMLLVMIKG
jgi:quercetin dioxygenase-like cupin family protein